MKNGASCWKNFFHDNNNILNSLYGSSQLLNLPEDPVKKEKHTTFIKKACCRLSDEIKSQKRLLEAEQGQFVIHATTFSSADLLQEIKESLNLFLTT